MIIDTQEEESKRKNPLILRNFSHRCKSKKQSAFTMAAFYRHHFLRADDQSDILITSFQK